MLPCYTRDRFNRQYENFSLSSTLEYSLCSFYSAFWGSNRSGRGLSYKTTSKINSNQCRSACSAWTALLCSAFPARERLLHRHWETKTKTVEKYSDAICESWSEICFSCENRDWSCWTLPPPPVSSAAPSCCRALGPLPILTVIVICGEAKVKQTAATELHCISHRLV